jgi:hypothetical protein
MKKREVKLLTPRYIFTKVFLSVPLILSGQLHDANNPTRCRTMPQL